ncbi:hypothetical protein ACOMHN_023218 [Nucella lapillus]
MAVWCDEGVFAVAADVYLHETEQFKDLLLCLGPFHWTRILLRCQGKLLRGSGLDDALVECGVFGRGVIESALNGTHYVRALTGMLIVEDLIRSLQWQMFWQHKDQTAYPELEQVQALQTSLAANTRCPDEFETLTGQVEKLHQDFVEFEKECEAKSELCQFFGVWLRMVAVIKNAVVSDREGNWDLYVATVEDSMPIFAEFNCTNYQRYGSWYLEQIKVLEFTHPELYRRFSMGLWVVKDRPGWFCAVGGDMKVEQTIQRVSKGPGEGAKTDEYCQYFETQGLQETVKDEDNLIVDFRRELRLKGWEKNIQIETNGTFLVRMAWFEDAEKLRGCSGGPGLPS